MTEKEINDIDSRAVPLSGAPKEDIIALVDEVRRLRRIIRQNGAYRSISFPNMGKVLLSNWAQEALGESS